MRRATRQFRWKILQISMQVLLYDKLTAWLDLLYKLHRTVWGVPPASSDGKYYKLVYYDKLTAWLDLLYKLHRTVWGVPPASSDEKYYKLVYKYYCMTN